MLLNIVLNAVCHLYLKRLSITAYYFVFLVFFFCLILKIILVTIDKSVKKIKISHSLTAQCKLGEIAWGLSSGKWQDLVLHRKHLLKSDLFSRDSVTNHQLGLISESLSYSFENEDYLLHKVFVKNV